ncbi:MAG: hypothetical protein ACT4QG_03075 [Sporichthyaceae bacterium]
MAESPAPGFKQLGVDAEQVAVNFPRPLPLPPEAWKAAKVAIPEDVSALAEGVGYPT